MKRIVEFISNPLLYSIVVQSVFLPPRSHYSAPPNYRIDLPGYDSPGYPIGQRTLNFYQLSYSYLQRLR